MDTKYKLEWLYRMDIIKKKVLNLIFTNKKFKKKKKKKGKV